MNLRQYIYSSFMLCTCLFFVQMLSAQPKNSILKDVAMPAPNAASLGKYGDIPVSYFLEYQYSVVCCPEGPLRSSSGYLASRPA